MMRYAPALNTASDSPTPFPIGVCIIISYCMKKYHIEIIKKHHPMGGVVISLFVLYGRPLFYQIHFHLFYDFRNTTTNAGRVYHVIAVWGLGGG